MKFDNVLFTIHDGVGRITLNRPERLNCFVGSMREDIYEALCLCESEQVRVVILTGAGAGFCSGADVRFLAEVRNGGDTDALDRVLASARRVVTKIRELPKPVIAAVNGAAAGGGINLALACDVRIASDNATFGETFIRLGLHPDWGGTSFLPRLVGTATALELMLSGRVVTADEALRLGLVNRVVPRQHLDDEVLSMARSFARNSPAISAMIKKAVYMSLTSTFSDMLDYETLAQKACFELGDSAEGLNAFLEKRQPEF